ncbi:MAG: alkene reductase [Bacteroidota bacterium]
MSKLFSAHQIKDLQLNNRVVMAPMTRSRAINNIPNDFMALFYAQRADAGLIITEGTSPSPNGLGYPRIPGIFSAHQIDGWKKVTNAVHQKGGKIFLQLMHTGRVTHPDNLPQGAQVLAPSAVRLEVTKMWVDGKGLLDIPAPKAMTKEEVYKTIEEYVQASRLAVEAGFDGVEIHGANGYLVKQFLNPFTNTRTDEFGGSIENRSRFLLEVVERVAKAIGKEKVGLRISPYGQYNETPQYAEAEDTYLYLAKNLNNLGIAYLHINDQSAPGEPHGLAKAIRKIFANTIIICGGYDVEKAEVALRNNDADLVSFARPFIANPDLVNRYKNRLPLNQPKFDLLYTPGAEGYTDYPVFEDMHILH